MVEDDIARKLSVSRGMVARTALISLRIDVQIFTLCRDGSDRRDEQERTSAIEASDHSTATMQRGLVHTVVQSGR